MRSGTRVRSIKRMGPRYKDGGQFLAFCIKVQSIMKFLVVASTVVAIAFHVQALIAGRPSGGCTCGSNDYSSLDTFDAIEQAEGNGGGDYPHQYEDYEGFSFPSCSGKFYEYPWRLEALTLGDLLVPTVSYTTQMGISVLASPTPAHRPTTGLLSAACEVR